MITKTNFLKYVNSFNKQPGTYTEDEIFKICYIHRNLSESKNWAVLNESLGLNFMTAESIRKWTLRRVRNADPKYLDEILKEYYEITESSSKEKINQIDFEKNYKDKVQIKDLMNAYRKDLRNDAREDAFRSDLIEAVKNLKPIDFKKCKTKYEDDLKKDKEAVLLLSDLHIGVKCDNFYNKYNSDIAKERIQKLVEDVAKYCQDNKVKRLNVLNLGDLIHGGIHTNARVNQEFDLITQITYAAELVATALKYLSEYAAPEIVYRGVIDNHSRAKANKEDNIDSENFNRLIDYIIEIRLKDTSIEFKNDNLDLGLGLFKLQNGKKFMFSHGHQDNSNLCFQNAVGATREFIDYFALGHYHSNKLKEFQGMSVFVNGSICGTEEYALSKRLFNNASQRLLIFDKDNVLDLKINLQ